MFVNFAIESFCINVSHRNLIWLIINNYSTKNKFQEIFIQNCENLILKIKEIQNIEKWFKFWRIQRKSEDPKKFKKNLRKSENSKKFKKIQENQKILRNSRGVSTPSWPRTTFYFIKTFIHPST